MATPSSKWHVVQHAVFRVQSMASALIGQLLDLGNPEDSTMVLASAISCVVNAGSKTKSSFYIQV